MGKYQYNFDELYSSDNDDLQDEKLFVIEDGKIYGRKNDGKNLYININEIHSIERNWVSGYYSLNYMDRESFPGSLTIYFDEVQPSLDELFGDEEVIEIA